MGEDEGILRRLLGERSRLFELLVSAVVLAFGVNLLSGQLEGTAALVIGVVAFGGSLAYLAARFLLSRNKSAELAAFVVARTDGGELVLVPAYDFSKSLGTILRAAVDEEPDLMRPNAQTGQEMDFFLEAVEYLLLDDLSRELDDHFASTGSTAPLEVLGRDELSDLLTGNRFLELLSTPIEDRPTFQGVVSEVYVNQAGRRIGAKTANGQVFVLFEFRLPRGSSVSRTNLHEVCIRTPRATIAIATAAIEGERVPEQFPLYLGFDEPPENFAELRFSCVVRFTLRLRSLFSLRGWREYDWIDSAVARFHRKYDGDRFFRHIGWRSTQTTLMCLATRNAPERGHDD